AAMNGAGVYGGDLKNCVIITNTSSFAGGGAFRANLYSCSVISNYVTGTGGGGGAYQCLMSNCVVAGNISTDFSTGGLAGGTFGGTNYSCLISNNIAKTSGGGTHQSTNYNCAIVNNRASGSGGGSSGGTLYSCLLSSNTCNLFGGGSVQGVLYNCILCDNIATNQGGGNYGGLLYNCTVVGNVAVSGGGGVYSSTLYNGIVYSNSVTSGSGSNWAGGTFMSSCCTQPLFGGCFTNAPKFINYATRDLHLAADSPCINSGNNTYVTNAGVWVDFENHPRLVSTFVDVGAYEVQSPASILPYTWLWKYGLKTDGSDDFADTDGDGMNNWQEWKASSSPTDNSSVLRIVSVSWTAQTGASITWQSVFGVRYFVERAVDLGGVPAFVSLQEDILGLNGTTTFSDPSATNAAACFYRVGIR
ncbi:MAG: hypothetical protein JWM68_4971, partial [Verrucomicrobiales bacterium]|nr:hypothetical protein [Verrucomicrobiales bacterium]